jgi:hypothetical protein
MNYREFLRQVITDPAKATLNVITWYEEMPKETEEMLDGCMAACLGLIKEKVAAGEAVPGMLTQTLRLLVEAQARYVKSGCFLESLVLFIQEAGEMTDMGGNTTVTAEKPVKEDVAQNVTTATTAPDKMTTERILKHLEANLSPLDYVKIEAKGVTLQLMDDTLRVVGIKPFTFKKLKPKMLAALKSSGINDVTD